MGCVRFAGPLWRRNTGDVGNPMTFAETSLPRPGWTPVSETKTPSIGLGTSRSARPARRTSLFG